MAAKRRRKMREILMTIMADADSCHSDSGHDEDIELLLLHTFYPQERKLGCHLNPNDVPEDDFENLFRC
ncbi:hypothetical protein AC249_AIPGENE25456 [Exaiptasia diaphana]|nr:hypothetical protein AC249_AIPGENE25456 [Exaiptasia diaphana]